MNTRNLDTWAIMCIGKPNSRYGYKTDLGDTYLAYKPENETEKQQVPPGHIVADAIDKQEREIKRFNKANSKTHDYAVEGCNCAKCKNNRMSTLQWYTKSVNYPK